MLLDIKNVSFGYNGKTLFNNVSLSVNTGDLVVIGGPSGSGKSSFLRLLNRLNDPSSGEIGFNDRPLSDYKVVELRRQIIYLQQTPFMTEGTIRHNLTFPYSFKSSKDLPKTSDIELLKLLDRFKLTGVSLEDSATTLSLGQKQRLAFIRALLLRPKILLLDEPTSALDQESKAIVEEHIENLASEENLTIIMITHLDFAAKSARRCLLSGSGLREIEK